MELETGGKIKEQYRIIFLRQINKELNEIKIIYKFKIDVDEITTIKDLKYYIINKYKDQKFCPCILSISIPFEDCFFYSELNDTPEKILKDCFPDKDIYIIIDFERKCDCGFNDLENLSKIEIFEKYNKEIIKLKHQIELLKSEKEELIKNNEELNRDILINFDKNLKMNKKGKNNITNTGDDEDSEDNEDSEDSDNNNTIKFIDNKLYLNSKFENFYDVIIDIQSIKDINIGWEIKMNKNGEKRFNEYKYKEALIIGIIGNSNRGKSFLLSKISKIELPTGTSIRTEGLSIKYPELDIYKNRNIILLDSAGLETPLLLEKENLKNKEDNEIVELLREKARDKLMTELFLQNFIVYNSNILISVVGILTYSEQKLLNRIREECKKTNKTLFIIHNLMTFTHIKQVQQYIKNYLLKDATFDLEERTIISSKKIEKNEKRVPYYYEKNNKIKIFHLIFANEGSEAGNYYNDFALNFFENSYQSVTHINSFDVIQRLKERFKELSKDLIEKNENNLWIEEKDFLNNAKILKEKRIRLKSPRDIVLKRCYIDELGFSNLRNNGFNPNYNYYEKDNKLIIRVEVPGNVDYLSSDIRYSENFTIIQIKGKKKKDKEPEDFEDNIFNIREFGEFIINIPIIKTIRNRKCNIYDKKGVFIIEYELEDKNNYKIFEFNGDDNEI